MDSGDRSGPRTTRNQLFGSISGAVIQAGNIGHVHLPPEASTHPPSQLPPASRFFTGRDREMAELARWCADSGADPVVAVITGPGGVGKTTLALRWLHDRRNDFPDGQLYAELGGAQSSGTGPARPEEVLEWFLLALGLPPERVPAGLAERASLYRSMTADRVIAVLLDNALSVAQVRSLLPASTGSVVVVTSRWRLAGLRIGGARFLAVEPLGLDESVALLDRIVGDDRVVDERDQATELARLCGGMPIALSVAGARLTARPNRPLGREVGQLREADPLAALAVDGEASVQAVFDVSYDDLRPHEARVYRTSALHPGRSFGVGVVAAGVRQPVEDVEDALAALAERSLLTETADRRFRFHDLLLVHAQHHADREPLDARRGAVRRMIEWYLDMLVRVDLTLRPTRRRIGPRFQALLADPARFETPQVALGWAEYERDNIVHAVRAAVEREWADVAWQFCEALWGFLVLTRHYDMWLDVHKVGLAAAVHCDNRPATARLHTQLAGGLAGMRQYEKARDHLGKALDIARHDGDRFGAADALAELAGIARVEGDLTGALDHLSEIRAIREVIGTDRALAVCRRLIGEVLCELGRFEEGTAELTRAAAALADVGDVRQQERALTGLGIAYTRWDRPAAARERLDRALDMARQLGIRHDEAVILAALGDVAERTGDLAAARTQWSAAAAIFAETDDPMTAELAAKLGPTE